MNSIGQEYYFDYIPESENFPEWVTEYDIGIFTTPYFFFNFRVTNGIEMYILGSIGCLLLITGCQYFWISLNNLKFKNKEKIKINNKWNKNRINFWNEIIKMFLFSFCFIISIILLTKTKNYQFIEDNLFLYNLFYLILYLITLSISFIGIVLIILKFIAKKENKTFDFILQFFCAFFLIHIYFITILFFIPIIIARKFENKLNNEKEI
ncbi:hypothetical protein [Spiroplasma taiwanense]|uniref:Transmembrane protein n=1 Tax=Spiroplasma taiwanense CT-1 TaxID=1276220 RepID=S5MG84_9MOLU|nr:hypothetical protein [Spiroplasma taiwanense]AGR40870.1 hypothetical protein STAIW_v1c01930 [Spiroplasma taiwanense CT-1]